MKCVVQIVINDVIRELEIIWVYEYLGLFQRKISSVLRGFRGGNSVKVLEIGLGNFFGVGGMKKYLMISCGMCI